jgi:hydroxymethylbilane synthase
VTHEVRIGTRGSALALVQARLAAVAIERSGRVARLVTIETDGDRRAPDTAWGEGAFVKSIEQALIDGRIDVAVHSAKDVPTEEDARLVIGAYLPRADARDALVVAPTVRATLDDLPAGATVGTDSPRRTAFVLARRPDLRVRPLHGNVDTRLHRLDTGEVDAAILACAGLDRLGRGTRIAERIDPDRMPPAPGQGAIALQIRRDDAWIHDVVAAVDHQPTRITVEAERALLRRAGGGCRSPIGAFGEVGDGHLRLLGGHARPDGTGGRIGVRDGRIDETGNIVDALYRHLWTSTSAPVAEVSV